jgi:hypothetical protein
MLIAADLAAFVLAGCASSMRLRAEGTHLGAVFVTSNSDARAVEMVGI